MIRNILWEADGALFDTYPAMTYAISRALNDLGLSVALNVIDGMVRQSLDSCLKTLSQRFRLDLTLLRGRFIAAYEAIPPANQPPRPGVDHVCALIHERGGCNLAMTHRSVRSTQALLDTHGLARWFDGIVSAEQGYSRQPDPAMMLMILKRYGLDPAETLLVGDSELEIAAGRSVGLYACLFGPAPFSQPVDYQIQTYSQLLTLLREMEQ